MYLGSEFAVCPAPLATDIVMGRMSGLTGVTLHPVLRSLRITPFHVLLETTAAFHAPPFKGPLLRSGLGAVLRSLECTTSLPSCGGCPEQSACFYFQAFETPATGHGENAPSRKPPHPFALIPPLDAREQIGPGERLHVRLVVYGDPSHWLPRLQFAIRVMGASGQWGGPFRIASIRPAMVDVEREGAGYRPRVYPAESRAAKLTFYTPLRLKQDNSYGEVPSFPDLFRALLRRFHLLNQGFGEAAPPADWRNWLLEHAAGIRLVDCEWDQFVFVRNSGRQHRTVPMHGFFGTLLIAGDLDPLLPFLDAGQWLGVGSATVQGYGFYHLETA